jgi:DNA-binding GntR family transcriptional regulator
MTPVVPTGPQGDSIRMPQLWQAVSERLRAEILGGNLPPGTKLIETELAEQFGTSRGPIREALRELAYQGLVMELPRRGAVVQTLSARDLAEVYAVRSGIELAAASSVIARATDEEVGELEAPLTDMEGATAAGADYLAFATYDFAFHRVYVQLSGNGRMVKINNDMLAQTKLLLGAAAQINPMLQSRMERPVHRDMFEAIRARDLKRTQETIAAHYHYAQERLINHEDPHARYVGEVT